MRIKKQITLVDVAKEAGVSISAVSKALLNGGGKTTKISDATREKIVQAAKKLNYRPNESARMLTGGKSNYIGILFSNPEERYYADLTSKLADLLAEQGYMPLLSYWRTNDNFSHAYDAVVGYRPAGIISCHRDHDYPVPIPTVVYASDPHSVLDTFISPNHHYPRVAADYLFELGHRKIGIAGIFPELTDAILARLAELGVVNKPEWNSPGPSGYRVGQKAAEQLLRLPRKQWPTAMLCRNDLVAIGLMGELHLHGVEVPRDMSVIGANDIEEAKHVIPHLTTISFSADATARKLIAMLFRRMEKPDAPRKDFQHHGELIIRNSCMEPCKR